MRLRFGDALAVIFQVMNHLLRSAIRDMLGVAVTVGMELPVWSVTVYFDVTVDALGYSVLHEFLDSSPGRR